jgi:Kinase binding protein CGI-121
MNDKVFSFPLALSRSGQFLYCSLHFITRPSCLSQKLRDSGATLALIDAKRIVGMSHLCCSANLACHRPKENESIAWDVVYLSSASNRFIHALRDYSFLDLEENLKPQQESNLVADDDEQKVVPVIILMVSSSGISNYTELLLKYGLTDSIADVEEFLKSQRDSSANEFKRWYKITDQELECFSLEDCVMTKVFTKMA